MERIYAGAGQVIGRQGNLKNGEGHRWTGASATTRERGAWVDGISYIADADKAREFVTKTYRKN